MNFRPVLLVIGILLTILAMAMVLPAVLDLAGGHPDWQVFAVSAGCTLFVGVSLILANRGTTRRFNLRQGFIMVTFSWLALTLFGALPLAFSELDMSFTDAFFESMSGITTTGSTVIVGLDSVPPGLLLWRAILQWLGGLGIIVMAIAILPILRIGGMQIFKVEAFDTEEKVLPKAAQMSGALTGIYVSLTLAWAIALWGAGMNGFEAVAHAMTTIATGGFSTSDGSVGHFNSATIDMIIIAGMVVGSLPFLVYMRMMRGDFRSLVTDSQIRWFLAIAGSVVLACTLFLWLQAEVEPVTALRFAAFNCISVMTGTGFATTDYGQWGAFATPLFFLIMVIGGCAGSTTCGIKIFRFQVVFAAAVTQMKTLLQPHGVFVPYYNKRPITDEIIASVLGFIFLFGLSFSVLAIVLGMMGLDYITAMSSAATAIANVGPGLGDEVGPAGTFTNLPDGAKWVMSFGMLLGRLELFTVLVLFTRSFWRG
ncbi:MAG: TrkH family potassium uptake protein [Magnetospiraceae bacterium]